MLDGFGRSIDYLRISVTDRCNLRCRYCMPEEGVEWLPHDQILRFEDILRLSRIFARLGVRRVRLTGGEPLVRRGLPELVAGLRAIPGIQEVALTTNGILLSQQLPALLEAGLTGVNLSLDTLNEDTFRRITRREGVGRTLDALDACLAAGVPVKVNCVPIAPEEELLELAALARDKPIPVRFIELMPIGLGKELHGRSEGELRALLEAAYGPLTPYSGRLGSGPSRYWTLPGFQGQIGFISALSHQFCHQCNRVRLTATGFLKTCLQYDRGVWLRPLLSGSDGELEAAIGAAILQKPAAHQFAQAQAQVPGAEGHMMSQIGG